MQNRRAWLLATFASGMLVGVCGAQAPKESSEFPEGILLIGAQRIDDSDACLIELITPAGKKIRTIFRHERGSLYPGGRISRQGDRLAVCHEVNGEGEFLTIDSKGEAIKIVNGVGAITAWSPDGQQIAYYGTAPKGNVLESFLIDLATGERSKLELEADYVAEDWHPCETIRTAIYMNPRNRMYREKKGDSYPARQLDLLIAQARTPITRNPSTDNIWSRFSPKGDRIAHYSRRLVGEKSLEYAVVCGADGSQPKEIVGFTEFGEQAGLAWFRPNGPPVWSPDGSTLAWIVSTNTEPTSENEQRELLFISVDGGVPRRLPLVEFGLRWVSAIEWR